METIENYKIGNKTIEEAFIGTMSDYDDFTTEIVEKLHEYGWVEVGEEYTHPQHNGKFVDYYTCLESTVYQMGVPFSKLSSEAKITLWRCFGFSGVTMYNGDDAVKQSQLRAER